MLLSNENAERFNAMIQRINTMSAAEVDALVNADQCPYEPEHLVGVPLGQFRCEVCGSMCVAGMAHPRGQFMEDELPPTDKVEQ